MFFVKNLGTVYVLALKQQAVLFVENPLARMSANAVANVIQIIAASTTVTTSPTKLILPLEAA